MIDRAAVRNRPQVISDLGGQVVALESTREDNPAIAVTGEEATWQPRANQGAEGFKVTAPITAGRHRPGGRQDWVRCAGERVHGTDAQTRDARSCSGARTAHSGFAGRPWLGPPCQSPWP